MSRRERKAGRLSAGLVAITAVFVGALAAAPVSITIADGKSLVVSKAVANAGSGNGSGNGGGNGNAGGNASGSGNGANGRGAHDKGPSLGAEGFSGPGKGKAKRRSRYERALTDVVGPRNQVGSEEATLTDEATAALVAVGWGSGKTYDSNEFTNHGEQVRTYVEIARALGYGGHVGSLQANFGSPYLESSESDEDNLSGVLVFDEEADEPEGDRDGGFHWYEVNLDVNGDGAITKDDLAAALAADVADSGRGGDDT